MDEVGQSWLIPRMTNCLLVYPSFRKLYRYLVRSSREQPLGTLSERSDVHVRVAVTSIHAPVHISLHPRAPGIYSPNVGVTVVKGATTYSLEMWSMLATAAVRACLSRRSIISFIFLNSINQRSDIFHLIRSAPSKGEPIYQRHFLCSFHICITKNRSKWNSLIKTWNDLKFSKMSFA